MKVFRLYPDAAFDSVTLVDFDDLAQFEALDNSPCASTWRPVEMEIVSVDEEFGVECDRADAPWWGTDGLMLRDTAIHRAGPVLAPFGELLPLTCATAELAYFHSLLVLDVLAEEHSEIDRFRDGRIMSIEQYAFHEAALAERSVFRIPQDPTGYVLYTEPVVDELRALGLAGLDFTMVWESSGG